MDRAPGGRLDIHVLVGPVLPTAGVGGIPTIPVNGCVTRVIDTMDAADVLALALHNQVQFVFAAIDQLFRFLQTQVVETGVIDL